jgi:hypothetical protein
VSESGDGRLESSVKLITPILAVAAFAWGIYSYLDTSRLELARRQEDALRTAETRRIEATRPYLDRQLALYTEATKVTATIATASDKAEIDKAVRRFQQLYWGELALVERGSVAQAMVDFRDALEARRPQRELGPLALRLAHACRDELAASWDTEAWKR